MTNYATRIRRELVLNSFKHSDRTKRKLSRYVARALFGSKLRQPAHALYVKAARHAFRSDEEAARRQESE